MATLVGWSYALNWLTYSVPAIERLVSPPAVPVVRDGRLLLRNMRAEFLTEEELMRQLRLEGVEDVSEVKVATVEADGALSVTKKEGGVAPVTVFSTAPVRMRPYIARLPLASARIACSSAVLTCGGGWRRQASRPGSGSGKPPASAAMRSRRCSCSVHVRWGRRSGPSRTVQAGLDRRQLAAGLLVRTDVKGMPRGRCDDLALGH